MIAASIAIQRRRHAKLLAIDNKDAQGHAHLNLARVYVQAGRLAEAGQMLNSLRSNELPAPPGPSPGSTAW